MKDIVWMTATLALALIIGLSPNHASAQDCVNGAGTWDIDSVWTNNCEGTSGTDDETFTVTQNGCSIQVTDDSGETHTGTVTGNNLMWTDSYPEEGGTTTEYITLTVSGDNLTGSASWTWTGPYEICSGGSEFSGTRTGVGDNGGGDGDGGDGDGGGGGGCFIGTAVSSLNW